MSRIRIKSISRPKQKEGSLLPIILSAVAIMVAVKTLHERKTASRSAAAVQEMSEKSMRDIRLRHEALLAKFSAMTPKPPQSAVNPVAKESSLLADIGAARDNSTFDHEPPPRQPRARQPASYSDMEIHTAGSGVR